MAAEGSSFGDGIQDDLPKQLVASYIAQHPELAANAIDISILRQHMEALLSGHMEAAAARQPSFGQPALA